MGGPRNCFQLRNTVFLFFYSYVWARNQTLVETLAGSGSSHLRLNLDPVIWDWIWIQSSKIESGSSHLRPDPKLWRLPQSCPDPVRLRPDPKLWCKPEPGPDPVRLIRDPKIWYKPEPGLDPLCLRPDPRLCWKPDPGPDREKCEGGRHPRYTCAKHILKHMTKHYHPQSNSGQKKEEKLKLLHFSLNHKKNYIHLK